MTLPPYARFDPERESTPETADAAKMLTRRAVLVRAGGVGLSSFTLAGLLAACGSGNQSNSSTSSGSKATGDAPGRGGTLTLAVDGTNGIADPAFYTTLGDWMAVDCICRGLTFIDFSDTKPKPDLAESWDVSDDGRIYRFTLREGVKFHDDTTLSSKDVVRSLQRQLNPKDPTLPPGGSGPFFTAVGDNIKSMKAVDDMTVEFKLKVPDALLLAKLSDIGGRVISSAALEKYKKDIGTHLTGTGPFRLVDARQGEAMTMEAFEDYKDGRPPIDRLVLQQAQDPSTIVGSIIGGQIGATQFTPYSALEDLSKNDKVTVYDTKRGFDAFVMMDVRRPVMKDIRVRKAINKAIDRSAIIQQAFFGVADDPKGYAIPTSLAAHDESLADISTQDMAEAKKLVEEAGAKGKTVWVLAASDSWHPRAAQIIVQNLKEAGLDAKSELVDPGTYAGRVFNPDDPKHDMMVWERNQFVPDPDNMVGAMANPNQVYGAVVSGQITLPDQQHYVADLIKARNLPDGDERKQAYTDIQREWADKEMVLAMLAYSANPVVSGANVKGMNTEALSNHRCFMEGASV